MIKGDFTSNRTDNRGLKPIFSKKKTMKFGIAVHTVKIRKRAKFEHCNLNGYQDMDVTNLDQNTLILSETDHL